MTSNNVQSRDVGSEETQDKKLDEVEAIMSRCMCGVRDGWTE